MALSGNNLQKASWNSNFGLKFYWSGSQNIADNYTDITVNVYGWLGQYGYLDVGSRTGSININGNNGNVWMPAVSKYDSNVREIKLATRTVRVKHRDDGKLPNVYISAVWPIQAYIDGVYRGNISCGFNTGAINDIPRSSSITSNPSFTIGNNLPVVIRRASDSFKHDVFLRINNSNFKSVSKINTNHTFTFNDSDIENLYELTKNSSSIDCVLMCDTYSGNTKIGSTSKSGKVYVDESSNKPVFEEFTFEATDLGTKELTGWVGPINKDNGLSIKNKTIYQINCGQAVSKNKATIVRYELELNKKTTSSTNEIITANSSIEYDDFLAVSAVDSRGFKTTISKKIVCQNYESIKPINAEIERQNYPDNTKVKIDFSGVISKSDTLNNTAKAYYRINDRSNYEDNYSDWEQIDIVVSNDGNISITDMVIDGFELSKVYDFELKINDYYSENIITTIVTADKPIFSIKKDGIYQFGEKINIDAEKNIMCAWMTSSQSSTIGQWGKFYLPIDAEVHVGTAFSLSNHKVIVGKNVTKVIVSASASIMWDSATSGEIALNIYKKRNGVETAITNFVSNKPSGLNVGLTISSVLEDVQENDEIYIALGSAAAGKIGAYGYEKNKSCRLYVEKVE